MFDFSNVDHGGRLGTATLENNKVFLRRGSTNRDYELEPPKGFRAERTHSVFED